jgi:hypothetical protein
MVLYSTTNRCVYLVAQSEDGLAAAATAFLKQIAP